LLYKDLADMNLQPEYFSNSPRRRFACALAGRY
jgi:hypothetical protein